MYDLKLRPLRLQRSPVWNEFIKIRVSDEAEKERFQKIKKL